MRVDKGISELVEAILTVLTRNYVYKELNGVWQESEIIVDWLVTKSSISEVLKEILPTFSYQPTMKYTRGKERVDANAESEKYIQRLGLNLSKKVFSVKDDYPTAFGKQIEDLTQRETKILSILVNRGGGMLTMEELGNILFENPDNFSLQAIAKQIQRLRDKLEANGVSGSFIQTKRGEGYLLVS